MIILKDKKACSGCGACREVCPTDCIEMVCDEEGFKYPSVNAEKCIDCHKCEKKCPVINSVNCGKEAFKQIAYAAKSKNGFLVENSSSGGIFSELAQNILDKGGVVFGAAFDKKFNVKHIYVDSVTDLYKLRGSKYVQSDIGDSYKKAHDFLKEGRYVLFTGTPCQISGLYAVLGKDFPNLYTQDIICHGVPSPLVWRKYIDYRKKRMQDIKNISFRNKKYGWKDFSLKFKCSNNKEYAKTKTEDLFLRGFLKNLYLRPSCYECAFKTESRISDFTLADFWGIENIIPESDDNKGTSLVIINSDRGKQLFDEIKSNLNFDKVNLSEAVKYNTAMLKSAEKNADREKFMRQIASDDFKNTAKHFLKMRYTTHIKQRIKNFLRYRGRK